MRESGNVFIFLSGDRDIKKVNLLIDAPQILNHWISIYKNN